MKKTIILAMAFLALNVNAQKKVISKPIDIKIIETKDKYTQELSYSVNKSIVSKKGSTGVEIKPNFHNDLIVGISVYTYNLGSCNENNRLEIILENNELIAIKALNDYNCNKWFNFWFEGAFGSDKVEQYDKIKNNKIKSIRVTNGYTYDSYEFDVPLMYKDYFIRIFNDFENDIIIKAK